MSIKNDKSRLDRTEMRVFLTRIHMTGTEFCAKHGININTFNSWMQGVDLMPMFEARITQIIETYKYPIHLLTDPDLRLRIEAATA